MRTLDKIFIAAVCGLIVLAPLAFGAVYPAAYGLAECAAFGLLALWMLKLRALVRAGVDRPPAGPRPMRPPATALMLLAGLIAFQCVPLPPSLLRVLSPATFDLNARVDPPWPAAPPEQSPQAGAIPEPAELGALTARIYGHRWRPLTIAWPVTGAAALGAFAVAALFAAVAGYPFGAARDEVAFIRATLIAILATGLLVAIIGLVNWAAWNGKVLWSLVPWEWGRPRFGAAANRASGPFVDPDHFAGYLAMIFPLALAGVLFGGFPARRHSAAPMRIVAGAAVLILLCAVTLSQSRAGWCGLALGTLLLLALVYRASPAARRLAHPAVARSPIGASLAIVAALLAMALLFVGAEGRQITGARIGATLAAGGVDLHSRLSISQRALEIVRRFPLFGVGLGGWPEIFPHFELLPRGAQFFNHVHNDYLEFAVGAGALGVALLGWFGAALGVRLAHMVRAVSPPMRPPAAALVAGLAVMALIEFFDFDLQIPANLLLFATLAALAMRIGARVAPPGGGRESSHGARARWRFALGGAAAAVLGVMALSQRGAPYPYDIAVPRSVGAARAALLRYPANSYLHLAVAQRLTESRQPAARELATAVWLDPTGPIARDLYARQLLSAGRPAEAMNQIEESVFAAPDVASHWYLDAARLRAMPDDQRSAVERGLKRAVAARFDNSLDALGSYYDALDRPADRAQLYAAAAGGEANPARRGADLRSAGDSYLAAGEPGAAQAAFERAIAADPRTASNYTKLIAGVLVPHLEFTQAQKFSALGLANGADPCALALSVAAGADQRGRHEVAEQSLGRALESDPASFQCTLELGKLYARSGRNARAAMVLGRAVELKPDSAEAYLALGRAAEANYDYFAAQQAYARALALAPGSRDVAEWLTDFKRKLAAAASAAQPR